jgi:hypothetical protein
MMTPPDETEDQAVRSAMNVTERGLRDVLDDAEGLANVLRIMSEGRLDLTVTAGPRSPVPGGPLSWGDARAAARAIGALRIRAPASDPPR